LPSSTTSLCALSFLFLSRALSVRPRRSTLAFAWNRRPRCFCHPPSYIGRPFHSRGRHPGYGGLVGFPCLVLSICFSWTHSRNTTVLQRPLSPGRCCHPRITRHSYPSQQGCPSKWFASVQLYNHCSSGPASVYRTRLTGSCTGNVACLCAILQFGPQGVLSHIFSTASRKPLSRLSSPGNGRS
jgi:hypothetical protein